MKRLVLASGNAGKLTELHDLLSDAGYELHAQSGFGVEDIEETGLSFVENAILKARHASRATGLPALGDDSGLCVDALDGAPGLYSARYAGMHGDAQAAYLSKAGRASDAANVDKLLGAMMDVPDARRGASFVCVLALLRHAADPQPVIVEGRWRGEILRAPQGSGGFGYDPVFLVTEHGRSAAELDPVLKNRISHRGLALAALRERLAAL